MLRAKTRKAKRKNRLRKQQLQRSRRLTRRFRRAKYRGGSLPIPEGSVAAVSIVEQGKVGDVDSVPTLIRKDTYDSMTI